MTESGTDMLTNSLTNIFISELIIGLEEVDTLGSNNLYAKSRLTML